MTRFIRDSALVALLLWFGLQFVAVPRAHGLNGCSSHWEQRKAAFHEECVNTTKSVLHMTDAEAEGYCALQDCVVEQMRTAQQMGAELTAIEASQSCSG